MVNKNRLLTLLRILQNDSYEHHSLTKAQVREALAEKGCRVSKFTLRDDITSFQKSGYEIDVIEKNSTSATYGFMEREWSAPELQLLINEALADQFFSVDRSDDLIKKLAGTAGPFRRDSLQPQILISEHIKANNKKIIFAVQAIREAIMCGRKITFNTIYIIFRTNKFPNLRGHRKKIILFLHMRLYGIGTDITL